MPKGRGAPLDPYQDSFIGREAEQRSVAAALGRVRLVSLVGPPGIGKTRLALRVAEAKRRAGARVALVDLTEARDARDFGRLCAGAVGAPDRGPGALAAAFEEAGELLLVVDNFEHLVPHASPTVGVWLARAPGLRVLCTSREPLRLTGEETVEVAPLSLPENGTAAAVLGSEAAQLFLDRATAYRLEERDAPVIARIVQRLDGIPLAIQLAASRMTVLSPRQLLDRLDHRFELLASAPRDAPSRHATLRRAIDWSWSLLASWERTALAHASVFRGGFRLDGAEAVVELEAEGDAAGSDLAGGSRGRPVALIDALQGLRDKSLLRCWPLPDTGEVRFALYESIREYAHERLLEREDCARVITRRDEYFERMARDLGAHLVRPGLSFVGQLELELDNLVEVLEAMLDRPSDERRSSIAIAMQAARLLVQVVAGRAKLGAFRFLEDATADVMSAIWEADDSPRLRAAVLGCIGSAYGAFGRPTEAQRYFVRAMEAAADDAQRAHLHYGLGTLHLAQRRWDEGRQSLEEAEALGARLGDRTFGPRVQAQYGNLHLRQGRPEQALEAFASAVEQFHAAAHEEGEALALGNLALAQQELGRFDEARHTLARAVALHRARGDRLHEGGALGYLAATFHEERRYEEAAQIYDQAIAAVREGGGRWLEGLFLCWRAGLEAARDRLQAAAASFEVAEARLVEVGDRGLRTALELHLASVDLARGRAATAACDERTAREHRARAQARIEVAARELEVPGTFSTADQSDDLRFVHRLLQGEVRRGVTRVARDGSWVELPDAGRVSLAAKRRLVRLLAAFAERHLQAPLASLTVEELVGRGWPGERMDPLAAQNRVQVALTTLRNLGLRDVLTRTDDGYRLGPGVMIVP